MNHHAAERLARRLMVEHGIGHWSFRFDRAVRRLGQCSYREQRISLSRHFVGLNDESVIRNTILHEIAHALVGPGHGHDYVWRMKARSIGCDGKTCADHRAVNSPAAPWVGTCPGCGKTTSRHRLTEKARKMACARCCRGRWNAAYVFVWERKQLTRSVA